MSVQVADQRCVAFPTTILCRIYRQLMSAFSMCRSFPSPSLTFSYASPYIGAIYPSALPTYVADSALQVITAVVYNLPVYFSSVRYSVLWGMPGPAQQTVTPVVPTFAAAIAAETNPDGSVNISIPLPSYKPQPTSKSVNFGAGSNIPLELLVLPPSATASTPISTTPITAQTLFSYTPPTITGVSVVRARFANSSATNGSSTDTLAVACPFAPNDPVWPCSGINTTGGPLLMVVIEVRRGFWGSRV